MAKKLADAATVKVVRERAGDLDAVRISRTAFYDIMGANLTKADICDAICDWIDNGSSLWEVVTNKAEGFIGEPAYVATPDIGGSKFYVKVSLQDSDLGEGGLLIISAHLSR